MVTGLTWIGEAATGAILPLGKTRISLRMHCFSMVALIMGHAFSGFNYRNLLSWFWGLKLSRKFWMCKIKVEKSHIFSEDTEKGSFPGFPHILAIHLASVFTTAAFSGNL